MLLASHQSEYVFPSINGGELAKANFSYHYWRPIADGRPATVIRGKRGGRGGSRRPLPAWREVPAYKGKRLYLVRHGAKEWTDEDGHSRVAVESRMRHELPGVEGTYSNVTPVMERAIMVSLQVRWVQFAGTLGQDWEPISPRPLPVDLVGWMNRQVTAAASLN
ncbi:hypothetical protein ACFT7S_11290 [Streptomyces sp. NPDC057136]|uniref:hypothetical protein n=1 Tax=Streptomyces sp. NPDC057136 TaxID=3346029 RepID=UPI003633A68B